MKQNNGQITRKSFRETFVTKQILNEKSRKLMRPHQNQIMNQIAASIQDQQFKMEKSITMQGLRKSLHVDNRNNQSKQNQKQRKKRPNTAGKYSNVKYSKFNQQKSYTQQKQFEQSNRFVQKLNYQIKQIEKISKYFKCTVDQDNDKNNKSLFNNIKKSRKTYTKSQKATQPSSAYPHTTQYLQLQSQLQQSRRFRTMLQSKQLARIRTKVNLLQSQQRQSIKKIIPLSKASQQDVKLLTRCITGCYFDDKDDYCDSINKLELSNIQKKFVTFDTLYNMVRGDRNKGIKGVKMQDVNDRSLVNLVYYLENQKTFKVADKRMMQVKMRLNQ